MSKSPVAQRKPDSSSEASAKEDPPAPVVGVAPPPPAAAPVAMVPPVPSNTAGPVPLGPPFRRKRGIGSGPTCTIPGCLSDMTSNRVERTGHPFIVKVYYKCLNPKCASTAGPFSERRR